MEDSLNQRLRKFKDDCLNESHDLVVQRYLLDGPAYFFEKKREDEFLFKRDIAEALGIHIRDIAIVGSGKLGFSIKPDESVLSYYPFNYFDQIKTSDLDVAIISPSLFDKQLRRLFEYTAQYTNQNVWPTNRSRNFLAQYALKGWIVPEYLPSQYRISDQIEDVQTKYEHQFKREINIGIYKSWYFFEKYHIGNVLNIHVNLIAA